MITCLGKRCLFDLLCISFMGVSQSVCVLLFLLVFWSGVWDLIVLIPDHCPSIYLKLIKCFDLS